MTSAVNARRPANLLAGLTIGFAVIVGLFGWSLTSAGHAPELHGVKVAVVGPAAQVSAMQAGLQRARPGAITVVTGFEKLDPALAAVRDRSVYAALALSPPRLYVASAAGPAVATALEAAFDHALASRGPPLAVSDLRPLDPGDPRGLAVEYIVISTVIGSVAFSVVRFVVTPGAGLIALAASSVGFAVLVGLAEAISVDLVVGALQGSAGAVLLGAGALSLAVTAITGGLMAVLKLPGAAVAALVVVIAGNASSGGASAPELVDGFWRHVGPYLPPGAGATTVRNLVYFDGHSTAGPLGVLLVYLLVGAALAVAGTIRRSTSAT